MAAFSDERRQAYLKSIGKKRGKLSEALTAAANTAWFFLEQTDKMTSTQIWLARFWQESHEGKNEAEAAALADGAVRSSIPGSDRAELPAFARDPGAAGSIVVFYGYFSKMFNVLHGLTFNAGREWTKAARGQGSYSNASLATAKAAGRALAVMFAYNVLGELLAGRGPDEGEPPEEYLLRKMVAAPINVIPLGAGFEAYIGKAITGRGGMVSQRAAPVVSMADSIYRSIGKAMSEDGTNSERVWAAVDVALLARGLPSLQTKRTGGYLEKLLAGDAEPEGPGDLASGLLFGERDNQPMNIFTMWGDD
jgi:hypothetical protein